MNQQQVNYQKILNKQNLDVFDNHTIIKNRQQRYQVDSSKLNIHAIDPELSPEKNWYVFTSGYLEGGLYDNTFENIFYVMKKQIEENKDDLENYMPIGYLRVQAEMNNKVIAQIADEYVLSDVNALISTLDIGKIKSTEYLNYILKTDAEGNVVGTRQISPNWVYQNGAVTGFALFFSEFGTGYAKQITTNDILDFALIVQNLNISLSKIVSPNSLYRGYLLQHNPTDETIREIQYVTNSMFANMSINTGKLITTDAYRYLKSGQYKNLIELEKIPYSDIDISTIADGYLYKNTTLQSKETIPYSDIDTKPTYFHYGADYDIQYITDDHIENNTINGGKILDNTIAESKILISNAPTNLYYLQWTTANGMTWSAVSSSVPDANITVQQVNCYSVIPRTNAAYNLGSTSYYFQDSYTNNLYTYNLYIKPGQSNMNFSGNLIPIANSTYTLGNATYKIAYVHANQIRSYSTAYFASIYPDANNSYYLGSTTAQYYSMNAQSFKSYTSSTRQGIFTTLFTTSSPGQSRNTSTRDTSSNRLWITNYDSSEESGFSISDQGICAFSPCDFSGPNGCFSFGDSDNTDVTNPSALATSSTFITWSTRKLKTNIKYTDVKQNALKYVNRFRKIKFCSYLQNPDTFAEIKTEQQAERVKHKKNKVFYSFITEDEKENLKNCCTNRWNENFKCNTPNCKRCEERNDGVDIYGFSIEQGKVLQDLIENVVIPQEKKIAELEERLKKIELLISTNILFK